MSFLTPGEQSELLETYNRLEFVDSYMAETQLKITRIALRLIIKIILRIK